MADLNGKVASTSLSTKEILLSVGDWPYLEENYEGPETAGVADVLVVLQGDLLKIDAVTGKVARYQAGDTEDIEGVASEDYNSTALNAAGSEAGHIVMYTAGKIRKSECYRLNAAGLARELVDRTDIVKARKMGMRLK